MHVGWAPRSEHPNTVNFRVARENGFSRLGCDHSPAFSQALLRRTDDVNQSRCSDVRDCSLYGIVINTSMCRDVVFGSLNCANNKLAMFKKI